MSSKGEDEPDEIVVGIPISPQESVVRSNVNDNTSTPTSLHHAESAGISEVDFKPSKRLYIAFSTLSVITLMVALDGTSLSVALPVRLLR